MSVPPSVGTQCCYLTVWNGEGQTATSFVLLEQTPQGLVGAAPIGFLPTPLHEESLPLADNDPGDDPVVVAFGVVPHGDVVQYSSQAPEGMEPLLFNAGGGWPDLDAVVASYTILVSGGIAEHPGSTGADFVSLDGTSLDGAPPVGAPPPTETRAEPPARRGRAGAAPRQTAAQQMSAVQASLEGVLQGQRELTESLVPRLVALENERGESRSSLQQERGESRSSLLQERGASRSPFQLLPTTAKAPGFPPPGAGRGSGLLDPGPRFSPPPGLSASLLQEVGPPPPRGRTQEAGPPSLLFGAGTPPPPTHLLGVPLTGYASASPASLPRPTQEEVRGVQERASAAVRSVSPRAPAPLPAHCLREPSARGNPQLTSGPGTQDPMAALLNAMERQTEAITALARRGTPQDPVSRQWSEDDERVGLLQQLPGARGATALETLQRHLASAPQEFSRRIRSNRDRRVRGASSTDQPSLSTRAYLVQEVPFNGAVSSAHFLFGMAEVFDMMEQGKWHLAEAHLGMLLVAGEQAAMDNWRWHHAARMSMVPDPPFHALIHVAGSTLSEPVSHLADQAWVATSMAYARDMAVFKDHAKARAPPPAEKDKDKDPKGKGKGKDKKE